MDPDSEVTYIKPAWHGTRAHTKLNQISSPPDPLTVALSRNAKNFHRPCSHGIQYPLNGRQSPVISFRFVYSIETAELDLDPGFASNARHSRSWIRLSRRRVGVQGVAETIKNVSGVLKFSRQSSNLGQLARGPSAEQKGHVRRYLVLCTVAQPHRPRIHGRVELGASGRRRQCVANSKAIRSSALGVLLGGSFSRGNAAYCPG